MFWRDFGLSWARFAFFRSLLKAFLRPNLPPGTAAAWRTILGYCGSCYKPAA